MKQFTLIISIILLSITMNAQSTPIIEVSAGACAGYKFVLDGTSIDEASNCLFAPGEDISLGAQNFLVTEVLNNSILNGVSTLDLVLIQRAIIEGFDNPIDIITADWDVDGAVSTYDLILIRRAILGIDLNASENMYVIIGDNTVLPSLDHFDIEGDFSNYEFADSDVVNGTLNVEVYKRGDVNGSAALREQDKGTKSIVNLEYLDRAVEAGQSYSVEFSVKNSTDILGLTTKLQANNLTFKSIDSDALSSKYIYALENDELALSYLTRLAGQEITFTVECEALKSGMLSDFISMDENTISDVVNLNEEDFTLNLAASGVTSTALIDAGTFEMYPNPVDDLLNITFEDQKQRVISLVNNLGQTVWTHTTNEAQLKVQREVMWEAGVYYLKVESDSAMDSKPVLFR